MKSRHSPHPDLILHSGKIRTFAANGATCEALACAGGRIVAVEEDPAGQREQRGGCVQAVGRATVNDVRQVVGRPVGPHLDQVVELQDAALAGLEGLAVLAQHPN